MIKLRLSDQEPIGPVSAILFDKDGTLIDSHSYWGAIIVERANMITSYYNLSSMHNSSICDSMGFCDKTLRLLEKGPVALESRAVVVECVIKHLHDMGVNSTTNAINEIFDLVSSNMNTEGLPLIRPIETAISQINDLLNLEVKIAIITSDTESNTLKFMCQTGLNESEILVIGRDNYPHAKKTGLPAAFAASELGVDISQCLVIGDAPMDYLMAINSGALHLLVSTGQLSYDTLRMSTNYVVKDLCEINLTPSP